MSPEREQHWHNCPKTVDHFDESVDLWYRRDRVLYMKDFLDTVRHEKAGDVDKSRGVREVLDALYPLPQSQLENEEVLRRALKSVIERRQAIRHHIFGVLLVSSQKPSPKDEADMNWLSGVELAMWNIYPGLDLALHGRDIDGNEKVV